MITRLLAAGMALAIVAGGSSKDEPGKPASAALAAQTSTLGPDIAKQAVNYCMENPKFCTELARMGTNHAVSGSMQAGSSAWPAPVPALSRPMVGTFAPHLATPPRRQSL